VPTSFHCRVGDAGSKLKAQIVKYKHNNK
jgi:hypothetical protein